MIDDGVVFLLTGNAFEVFAASIEDDQGRTIEGLGLLDIQVKRHLPTRFNSLFLGQHAQTKIVGYTSRFTHSYGYDQTQGLFSVTQGLGMNPEVNYEGIQVNNLFATYLLGPLLIQNPLFTRYLLGVIDRDAPLSELPYEAELMQAYETRVQEFESGIDFVD
jgi:CobQ-like glutamine amidotransferase family enzyme